MQKMEADKLEQDLKATVEEMRERLSEASNGSKAKRRKP